MGVAYCVLVLNWFDYFITQILFEKGFVILYLVHDVFCYVMLLTSY